MSRLLSVLVIVAIAAGPSSAAAVAASVELAVSTDSTFARSNLHVWAYEEYDVVPRTPDEHARVLTELGLRKAGYVCRNSERASKLDAYVQAYRRAGIELVSVWTPVHTDRPLEEPQIRTFLHVVERHGLTPQWWLTLEEKFERLPSEDRLERAAARLRPIVAEANRRGLKLVLYGHGRDAWFTQAENEIALVERLKRERPSADLGIVYSFHQSFGQMERFEAVLPRLKPWLAAVNLNAMGPAAKAGSIIGQGTLEAGMIRALRESGWRGPVGILAHNKAVDAKLSLQNNLTGLAGVLRQIGDAAGAATY